MSCNNYITGFSKCKKSVGGIKRVWATGFDNIAIWSDYDNNLSISDGCIGKISTLILKPNTRFNLLTEIADSVTLTTTITSDEGVGCETYANEVQVKIPDLYGNILESLAYDSYSSEYVFLFEDMQGRLFCIGLDNPIKLKQGSLESGTVIGDFNGGTLTFGNEGAISSLMTKYEAENGEWGSYYPKLSELTQYSKLEEIYNPLKNATVGGVTNGDLFINIHRETDTVVVDWGEIQEKVHSDHFSLMDNSISNFSNIILNVENDSDRIHWICRQLIKKGISNLVDKKNVTAVIDCRGSTTNLDGDLALGSYDNDCTYVVMHNVPNTSFVIADMEIKTINNPHYPKDGMCIEFKFNHIYVMPENWE